MDIEKKRKNPILILALAYMGYYSVSITLKPGEYITEKIVLVLMSIMSVVLGFFLITRKSQKSEWRISNDVPSQRRVSFWSLIGHIFSFVLFITKGVPIFSPNIQSSRLEIFSNGWIATLATVPLTISIILSGFYYINLERIKTKEFFFHFISPFLLLFSFGNRFLWFFPLLLLISHRYFFGNYGFRKNANSLGLSLIGLTLVGLLRDLLSWGNARDNLERIGVDSYGERLIFPIKTYVEGTSVAMDGVFANYSDSSNREGAEVLFSAFLSPLPGIQLNASQVLKETLGYRFIGEGLAMGTPAGVYMCFGFFIVFLWYLLLGMIIGKFWDKSSQSSRSRSLFVYFFTFCGLGVWMDPLSNLSLILIPIGLFLSYKESKGSKKPMS